MPPREASKKTTSKQPPPPPSSTSSVSVVRLHVSPLSPETYSIVVPASLRPAVSAVSYHQIPTFAERAYGYIDLPAADADKLQKRLHGALVRGLKVKTELARPKPVFDRPDSSRREDPDGHYGQGARARRKSERLLGRDGVYCGVRLPDTRRVRRGWTQPLVMKRDKKAAKSGDAVKSKSKAKRSEYTDKEECLFKTKGKEEPAGTGKKRKRGDTTKTIHEFEHTTKFPSFLRNQSGDGKANTAEYDTEKGWIDTEGKVVEQPRRSKRLSQDASAEAKSASSAVQRRTRTKNLSVTSATKKLSLKSKDTDDAKDDESSNPAASGSSADDQSNPSTKKRVHLSTVQRDDTSSSGSSGSESDDEVEDRKSRSEKSPMNRKGGAVPSLEVAREAEEEEQKDEVHPLEAIFKKPKTKSRKPPGLELKIPFSFFGDDDQEEEEDGGSERGDKADTLPAMPQTPFTQADLRFRRERSAAPTPDTAAPTKFLFGPVLDRAPSSDARRDKDSDSDASDSKGDAKSKEKPKRSEFAEKWFWENRGENNRAWKKQRREAMKEQRQVANRKTSKRI